MFKTFSASILFSLMIFIEALSQSSVQRANFVPPHHPVSADKESWQRLNLWLSSTFILVLKEDQLQKHKFP